jgi:hypothetical protein
VKRRDPLCNVGIVCGPLVERRILCRLAGCCRGRKEANRSDGHGHGDGVKILVQRGAFNIFMG